MATKSIEEQPIGYSIKNTITLEDINVVIKKYTNDDTIRMLQYDICNYSEQKLGLLGAYSNLTITFQKPSANDSENVNFFIKSVPYSCKEQADFVKQDGIYIKEANFFSKLIPNLTKNYIGDKWHPTCYLTKDDAIIMEDLRSNGYRMLDELFDDIPTLTSALATLARFHSCSILAEARLNEGSERRLTLGEYFPVASEEKMFVRKGKVTSWFKARNDLTCTLAGIFGCGSDKINKAYEHMYEIVKYSKDHWNVICHGGLRSNNLMFTNDSRLSRCVLIDFQTARYAPMVTDLLQFLHLNCTQSFRKIYEKDLLKFYQRELEESVKKNDDTGYIKIPTLQDIIKEMEDFRVYGLVMAASYFPFILIDPKITTKSIEDSDSYKNFMFGDQLSLTLAYMKVNEFYKNRVEEAVRELAEKSEELYK